MKSKQSRTEWILEKYSDDFTFILNHREGIQLDNVIEPFINLNKEEIVKYQTNFNNDNIV